MAGTPDSMDPGNTYAVPVWDFARLYARSLLTFRPAPGAAGLELVPDLATGLGQSSDGARTWTYHLRSGLKFSDGTPITSKDVKYAIERSNYAPDALSNGPSYFHEYLIDNSPPYQGPYKDPKGGLDSIVTPDDTTIVFHLNQPFAEFDYLATIPQTAPVPQAKDSGANYVRTVVSSGSYMFQDYHDGIGATLVRNPYWSGSSDPWRKQLPATIKLQFNIAGSTLDQNLLAGNATLNLAGGLEPGAQAHVLSDPALKKNADDAALYNGITVMPISTKVAPLDNVHCRRAVEWAVDKVSVQTALGGDVQGQVASTIQPPTLIGYTKFDLYPTPGSRGADTPQGAAAAKAELAACGQPAGFHVNLAVPSTSGSGSSPIAVAVQAALKKVGIAVTIQQYPVGSYVSSYAGSPAYAHAHALGLFGGQAGPDWPTGYALMYPMLAGAAIKTSGNFNLSELNDPVINRTFATAIANPDEAARARAWGQIDRTAMQEAAVAPLLYSKALLYRPPQATNIYVSQAYGLYDYLNVGTT
jgi:peptide/nickel transport system substrate-binding protein